MPDIFNKGEYDFLQKEAQNRVFKMRENGKRTIPNQQKKEKQDIKYQNQSSAASPVPSKPLNNKGNELIGTKHSSTNLMDMIMKDKERSLIILLIILLSQENSNPGLLLSLIYLLI